MSDLLSKLKAGRAFIKTFPLGELTLGLRLLVEDDYQAAGWAANDLLAQHDTELTTANAELFESEKATQLMLRFLVDPDTGKPLFPSADELRKTLSREERNAVGAAYYDFEREFSPSERTMSEAEFARLLADTKKKPNWLALSGLSGALLKRLVLSLAVQPSN
jgi:hypothetical protein